MPTTLLLDGPDLEALLVRARREGGPNARITRAEKVRRGGVMGFFAREVFEVAVDVPDGYVPDPHPQTHPAKPVPQAQQAQQTQDDVRPATGEADGDPFDAVVRAIAAMGAADAAGADLGALNAAGVNGTASRVRRAQRAATARAYSAGGYTAGGQVVGLAPSDDPTSAQVAGASSGGSYAATALLDRLEGRDGDGLHRPVPHETPLDPTNPSTEQPAFTTLLDQLRRETVDPSLQPGDLPGASPDQSELAVGPPSLAFAPLVPAQAKATPALAVITDASVAADPVADESVADESVPELTTDLDTKRDGTEPDGTEPVGTDEPAAVRRPARHQVDPRLKADRAALRTLGVPAALTRKLRAGDRFTAVRQMLSRLPVLDVDADAPVVAVVGPSTMVTLEAHRVAVDLAVGTEPRPILTLRPDDAQQRRAVVEASRRLDDVVVALTADDDAPSSHSHVRQDLRDVRAQVVVAVVDARRPLDQTRQWLGSLGRVDALAVEHAGDVADPAKVLELGVPVVRVDGVGMDALGWTAMICARLADAEPAAARRGAEEA